LDHKRDLNIAQKLEARKVSFLDHLTSLRSLKENLEYMKTQNLEMEEARIATDYNRVQDAASRSRLAAEALDAKREASIASKLEARKLRDAHWVRGIRQGEQDDFESRQKQRSQWRSDRERTRESTNDEAAKFVKAMFELDRKRETAFQAREARWQSKARDYLESREQAIRAAQRKQILLKEKKQAQLHSLFF
jgi:hypothetical protein